MNLLPKNKEEFSQVAYWERFFKNRGSKGFEWYGEYPELCQHLHKYIKPNDSILVMGCGNSNLSNDMYDIGYSYITNIDISTTVINQMQKQKHLRPSMEYLYMDAMNMSFPDNCYSVVLDKGTLDALMPDDTPETIQNITKYFSEILRVLKLGGRYVCISLLQSQILKMLLEYFPAHDCLFRIMRCFEAENYAKQESSMPVFMVICTKFKALKEPILELGLSADGKTQRVVTEKILSSINEVQRTEFICSGLRKGNLIDDNDVAIDLFQPGEEKPRFSIFIVDITRDRKFMDYSVFIVPQGREAEWLFSTQDGRKKLAIASKSNRLAVVTMHRNQIYKDFTVVQEELKEYVQNLAPSGFKEKILFLSLGSEVGNRVIQFKGRSSFSGDYVIEDVEIYEDNKYRRLYYLSTPLLIQSEAKLKIGKSRKGKCKQVVDLTYLTCKHHVYMSIASQVTCLEKPSRIALIGLGGGGLCMFLHKFLPNVEITVVDIDNHMLKVATEWFGLIQDKRLNVKIIDGLDFLRKADEVGDKYDAILFDVDNKDTTTGMSCPPKDFLELDIIDNVVNCLSDNGIFVLNIVLRNESLRPDVIKTLQCRFRTIIPFKLQQDLNEIITCCVDRDETLKNKLIRATGNIKTFFKDNSYPIDEINEVDDFVEEINKLK